MTLPFLKTGSLFIPDETPDAFSFTDQTGKNAATLYSSDIKQINGINVPVTAAISGGSGQLQVSSDSGGSSVVHSWASSVTVENGQYLQARLTTGGWDGTTTGHITVGLSSTDWNVTTIAVTTGTTNYSGAGGHSVLIPAYSFITIKISGAGGGGGGCYANVAHDNIFGGTGTDSSFPAPGVTLTAHGGVGGGNAAQTDFSGTHNGSAGAAGTASGGDFNTTGGGNAGGAGSTAIGGIAGGHGGAGGFVQKTWAFGDSGAPVVGNSYTLTLGAAGAGGTGDLSTGSGGSNATAQISTG